MWVKSFVNKWGRLAQGVGDRMKGEDTIIFVLYDNISKDLSKYCKYGL